MATSTATLVHSTVAYLPITSSLLPFPSPHSHSRLAPIIRACEASLPALLLAERVTVFLVDPGRRRLFRVCADKQTRSEHQAVDLTNQKDRRTDSDGQLQLNVHTGERY